jgi:hypothetical protein
MTESTAPAGEYTYPEAARLLGVGEDWLRHNTPKVPFPHYRKSLSRTGRAAITFTDAHLDEIRRTFFEIRPADKPAKRIGPVTRRTA